MKKIIYIITITFLSNQIQSNAQSIDTLQLLKTHIENNKVNYIGKPFKALSDTLKKLNLPIIEYSGPHDSYSAMYINDTIWVDGFSLYFDEITYDKMSIHFTATRNNNGQDTANTHIKFITIWFQSPIPYLRAWNYLLYADSDEHANLSGIVWNRKIANFYKNCIIKNLKVSEF